VGLAAPGGRLLTRATNAAGPIRQAGRRLHLSPTKPEVGSRYTDSGQAHDDNGLKHRPADEVRPVLIPPELVAILRCIRGHLGW
jgi:hypothetical protein